MGNKNKSKGTYHEKRIAEWFEEIGCPSKRQPLSGSLGGEYRGDLKVQIMGHELVVEVKYRDASGFPSPFSVMENRDLAVYKRRRGTPQTLVIIPAELFTKLMETYHAERRDSGLPETG